MQRAFVSVLIAVVGCATTEPPPPAEEAPVHEAKSTKTVLEMLGFVPVHNKREPVGFGGVEPVRTCFVTAEGHPFAAATVELTHSVMVRGMVASLNHDVARGCGAVLTGADGCADMPTCQYLDGHAEGITVETAAGRYRCGEAEAGDRVVISTPGCTLIRPRPRRRPAQGTPSGAP